MSGVGGDSKGKMDKLQRKDIKNLDRLKNQFTKLIENYYRFYTKRAPTRLLSEYGEVIVQLRMLKRFDIDLPKGQSKADLTIINRKTKEKRDIEIKTSSYKKEEHGKGWGVALNIKKCTEHPKKYTIYKKEKKYGDFCYFDYLIFIALDKTKPSFYIFKRKEIEKHKKELKNCSKRFKASTHRLWIPQKPKDKNKLSKFELGLCKNKKYLNKWSKIK